MAWANFGHFNDIILLIEKTQIKLGNRTRHTVQQKESSSLEDILMVMIQWRLDHAS